MQETAGAPKHNIISEWDFAHIDRQLVQKPAARTIALNGLICFMNNETLKVPRKSLMRRKR